MVNCFTSASKQLTINFPGFYGQVSNRKRTATDGFSRHVAATAWIFAPRVLGHLGVVKVMGSDGMILED